MNSQEVSKAFCNSPELLSREVVRLRGALSHIAGLYPNDCNFCKTADNKTPGLLEHLDDVAGRALSSTPQLPILTELKAARDAMAEWKLQVETHGGDYLPEHAQRIFATVDRLNSLLKELG